MPSPDLERPDLYVVARFLERLWTTERVYGRTDLQMAVRLNHGVFVKYLAWLTAKGLVSVAPDASGVERIGITPKGLDTYKRLVTWIRDTVGEEHL
jgi:hypothetical protein